MTLVAGFRFSDGFSYLAGDALISRPISSTTLNLPTISDITFEQTIDGVLIPSGLKQKVIVLSDHLAIGWSDSWIECAALIREIRDEFGKDEVSGNDVVKFLNAKENEYPNANLVGISKLHDTHHIFYFNGATKCAHSQLEDFYATGTGAKSFAEFCRGNILPTKGVAIENVSAIVGLFGGMLGQEMVNQTTVLNNFGGAFELVHFYADNTFKKLDQITYYYWSANQHRDGKVYVMGLPIIIKYITDGEASMVIRVKGNMDDCKFEGKIPNYQVEYFRLNPVIGLVPDIQWKSLETVNFNSTFQCHYIYGKKLNGEAFSNCLATFGGSTCKIEIDGMDLVISQSDEIAREIGQMIISEFNK